MALEAQVLGRVCRVVGESERPGTAVLLDRGERQYLVTARHLTLGEPEEHFAVQLPPWYPDPFRHLTLTRVGPLTSKADIAVFQLARPVADPTLHLPAGTDGLVWTQEAYLLGYPLNLSGRLANGQAVSPSPSEESWRPWTWGQTHQRSSSTSWPIPVFPAVQSSTAMSSRAS